MYLEDNILKTINSINYRRKAVIKAHGGLKKCCQVTKHVRVREYYNLSFRCYTVTVFPALLCLTSRTV
jgi:hypothetical protein